MTLCESLVDFQAFDRHFSFPSALTIVHVNIRSLRKHWDTFCSYVDSVLHKVDVFVLTEINISSAETDLFTLPGFISSWFTRYDQRGGGIAIFVQDIWSVEQIATTFSSAESLGLKISNQHSHISLLAIYRPPSSNLTSFLNELDAQLQRTTLDPNICLVGDFNIDILNPTVPSTCDYLDIIAKYGLESIIDIPTREELLLYNLVKSCIDHFNIRTDVASVHGAVLQKKVADHYFIACQLRFPSRSPSHSRSNTCHSVIDTAIFDKLVALFDWSGLLETTHKSELYTQFSRSMDIIYKSSERKVYVRQRRSNRPWMNGAILSAIKGKDLLWQRCRHTPSDSVLRSQFKTSRNKVNALIRAAKRSHNRNRFYQSRNNTKKTWSLINELRGSPLNPANDIQNNFDSDLPTVVNNFNQFFAVFCCV